VFEIRVLRRIFGPQRDEVIGGRRKLHNEKFRNLYSSPSIIRIIKSRRMQWTEDVACIGEKKNTYRIFMGKPEGKRPVGRSRWRWENNTKKYLRETGWGGTDWIGLAKDRDQRRTLVNTVMNLRVL
jgi:hypothetical protein